MQRPACYHRIDRTWDELGRLFGMKALPSAEKRIAQRLEEFEKAMAIIEGRRVSDASQESADSDVTAETVPLLEDTTDAHLKAE